MYSREKKHSQNRSFFNEKRLDAAFENFIEVKEADHLRPDTIRSYKSVIVNFSDFVDKKLKSRDIYVNQIGNRMAGEFSLFLNKKNINARTYNNYILSLRTIFDFFVAYGFTENNPFKAIKKKRNPIKTRLYINDAEKNKIYKYLLEHDEKYLRIVMMSYFTLLRRKEITMIKVGDIDLARSIVYVKADIAKNRKDNNLTIPPTMAKYLKEMNLSRYPKSYYLFSDTFMPGKKKLSPKKISDRWAKMRKTLNLSPRLQFMSLRDSGIKKLVQLHTPLDDVMNHARHWSLDVTKTYLMHDTGKAIDSIKNSEMDF